LTSTPDQTEQDRPAPRNWHAAFAALGYDGKRAATLVLDGVDLHEGPVLNLGSTTSYVAGELQLRGLVVESYFPEYEEALFEALPFPDGAYPSAVSFNTLHHVENGAAYLNEMARVVRPGGLLLLIDFTPEGFDIAAHVLSAEGGHPVGPVTLDWARGFLTGLGLEETRAGAAHHQRFATFRKPGGSLKKA
jgi:SAM-dependent methyltransferase